MNRKPIPPPEYTRWKPGQSGNPGGRGTSLRTVFQRLAAETGAREKLAGMMLDGLLRGVVELPAHPKEPAQADGEGKVLDFKQAPRHPHGFYFLGFDEWFQLLGYGYPMPRAKESDAETARTEASLRALHASVIERAQANGK